MDPAACKAARTVQNINSILADFQPAMIPPAITPACGRGFVVAAFQAALTPVSGICIKIRPSGLGFEGHSSCGLKGRQSLDSHRRTSKFSNDLSRPPSESLTALGYGGPAKAGTTNA
jgi:hypothetical protein